MYKYFYERGCADSGIKKTLDFKLSCCEIKKLYLVNIFISDISQIVQLLIGFK